MNDFEMLLVGIASGDYKKGDINKSMDKFFKTSNLDKLHDALCGGDGLNSCDQAAKPVSPLPESSPTRFYLTRICSWCQEFMGTMECSERMNGQTTHCICPSCLEKLKAEKTEREIIIENIKNPNTPIEVVETYKGDR